MTDAQKREYKTMLQKKCVEIIEQRMASIHIAMNEAQASANSEEKSSAGDKYETSRALSHLDKDMHARQLFSNMKEIESLLSVNCDKLYYSAENGSFVNCNTISFFIAAGLGKLTFENETIFLVSPNAPVSKMLFGKKRGDAIIFNNESYVVKEVF